MRNMCVMSVDVSLNVKLNADMKMTRHYHLLKRKNKMARDDFGTDVMYI